MTRRFALLALLVLAAPASASAQSLLNAAGLGVPTDPLDARTRAMGGVGIGLKGGALLGSDPAAAAGLILPTLMLTVQPAWVEYQRPSGASGTFQGTRFPNMGMSYPAWRAVIVTVSFESFLDQRYQAARAVPLDLGEGTVLAKDLFLSNGGVSQARLGFARRLRNGISVGLSVGRYTGSVLRRLERSFPEPVDGNLIKQVEPYQAGGLWEFSGTALSGGASVDIGTAVHVAGSFTWSTELHATPTDDTEGAAGSFHLPLQLRLGATAALSPGLSISAGITSADWSAVDDELPVGQSVGGAQSMGVGIELTRVRLFGRTAPIRFGYRASDLPFSLTSGVPTEKVWAGGFGLNLSQTGDLVRAGVGLAIEYGDRQDLTLTESFWRGTLTVRVAGF